MSGTPLRRLVGALLTTALATLGVVAITTETASAAAFTNGSFEVPDITGSFQNKGPGDTLGGGWIVQPGGNVDLINSFWTSFDGGQSLDLDGSAGGLRGAVCQTFDTVPDHSYLLRFAMSRNYNDPTQSPSNSMAVTLNGSPLGLGTYTHTGPVSSLAMNWVEHSVDLTGSGSDTICFASLSAPGQVGWGPALDAVRVHPEGPLGPYRCVINPKNLPLPGQQVVTVRAQTGLAEIINVQVANGSASVPGFTPGTTAANLVTITEGAPDPPTTWSWDIIDSNGQFKHCAGP